MAEATLLNTPDVLRITAPSALVNGQVVQLPSGLAGVIPGAGAGVESGEQTGVQTEGVFTVAKTASMIVLAGQQLWWDESENKAIHSSVGGDFILGVAVKAATASATTVQVDLNGRFAPMIDLTKGLWTVLETLGLGIESAGGGIKAQFDVTSEAATASFLSDKSIDTSLNPILEGVINIVDNGAAALDINIGFANAGHATDADDITESVFIHLDGNDLNIFAESDDGSTEVNATNTTKDYVVGTPFFFQIDASDLTDIQIYINGVNVLPASTFKLDAASDPMKALLHLEKTSDASLADVRVESLHIRTGINT